MLRLVSVTGESHLLTLGPSESRHKSNEVTLVLGVAANCSVDGRSKDSVSHRPRSACESQAFAEQGERLLLPAGSVPRGWPSHSVPLHSVLLLTSLTLVPSRTALKYNCKQ